MLRLCLREVALFKGDVRRPKRRTVVPNSLSIRSRSSGGDQFIEIDKNSGTTLKAVKSC